MTQEQKKHLDEIVDSVENIHRLLLLLEPKNDEQILTQAASQKTLSSYEKYELHELRQAFEDS